MGVYWVSKYALSSGIAKVEANEVGDGMIVDRSSQFASYYHGEGKDWHRTPAAAAERAEQMRVAKIASLKKQIAKLEGMTFLAEDTNGHR